VDETRAYKYGSLGLAIGLYVNPTSLIILPNPKSWWISAVFAFRDGIIDKKSMAGRICHNSRTAFAIVLRDAEEKMSADNPNQFVYRISQKDRGFFCLTNPKSIDRTHGVRVYRTHALSSLWAPAAGFRYDGQ
jgi:hypothetical protein